MNRLLARLLLGWVSQRFKHSLRQNQGGQVLVLGLIVIVALVMAGISVANIGIMVAERIRIQDTVDAAAYSQATVEARFLNLSAYINRGMIANYNAMAFNTSLWAMFDAYDHGAATLVTTIYELASLMTLIPIINFLAPDVDAIADALQSGFHSPMHQINSTLNDMFDQGEDTKLNEISRSITLIFSVLTVGYYMPQFRQVAIGSGKKLRRKWIRRFR